MTTIKLVDPHILSRSTLTAFQPSKVKATTVKMIAMLNIPVRVGVDMFMMVGICARKGPVCDGFKEGILIHLYRAPRRPTGVKLAHFVVVESSVEVEIVYTASILKL